METPRVRVENDQEAEAPSSSGQDETFSLPTLSPSPRRRHPANSNATSTPSPFTQPSRSNRQKIVLEFKKNGDVPSASYGFQNHKRAHVARGLPSGECGKRTAVLSRLEALEASEHESHPTPDPSSSALAEINKNATPSPIRKRDKSLQPYQPPSDMVSILEDFKREMAEVAAHPAASLAPLMIKPRQLHRDKRVASGVSSSMPSLPSLPSIGGPGAAKDRTRPKSRHASEAAGHAHPVDIFDHTTFSEQELEHLEDTFSRLDVDSKGVIHGVDLARVLSKVQPELESKGAALLHQIKNYASSTTGVLGRSEYLRWASANRYSNIKACFDRLNLYLRGPGFLLSTYLHRDLKEPSHQTERISALHATRPDNVRLPSILRERKLDAQGPYTIARDFLEEDRARRQSYSQSPQRLSPLRLSAANKANL